MSSKTDADVVIDGKVYTLSGYESPEYLQKVATYINNKIAELESMADYRYIPQAMRGTLIELNIADDYFKAKEKAEKLELDLEVREKELYDLKHDLISNQIKNESAETSMKELEARNQELLLNKARLEAALEDKLLDGKGSSKSRTERQSHSGSTGKATGATPASQHGGDSENGKSEDSKAENGKTEDNKAENRRTSSGKTDGSTVENTKTSSSKRFL